MQWGKLTDDDLGIIAGRREQLAGKLDAQDGGKVQRGRLNRFDSDHGQRSASCTA